MKILNLPSNQYTGAPSRWNVSLFVNISAIDSDFQIIDVVLWYAGTAPSTSITAWLHVIILVERLCTLAYARNKLFHAQPGGSFLGFLEPYIKKVHIRNVEYIEKNGIEQQIKQCAFRCLVNLIPSEAALLDPKLEGCQPENSYLNLTNDFREFRKQCHLELTPEQQQQIKDIVQLLEEATSISLENG